MKDPRIHWETDSGHSGECRHPFKHISSIASMLLLSFISITVAILSNGKV